MGVTDDNLGVGRRSGSFVGGQLAWNTGYQGMKPTQKNRFTKPPKAPWEEIVERWRANPPVLRNG